MQANKPTILEVAPLIKAYYAKPGNTVGGSLHIVLEDNNLEDSHIHYCIKHATERGDTDGVELANLLLLMSQTQRRKLASMSWYPYEDIDYSKRYVITGITRGC